MIVLAVLVVFIMLIPVVDKIVILFCAKKKLVFAKKRGQKRITFLSPTGIVLIVLIMLN